MQASLKPPPQTKRQLERWTEIREFLNRWYYRPDTEALAVALSVYASHLDLEQQAVWLFVVGPSGSGKTGIICNALKVLPSTLERADLSAASFISGLKGGQGNSLLFEFPKIGKDAHKTQGVLVLKDFSSVLSARPDTRAEIMSRLREIWDGSYCPSKGTKIQGWEGKISVIAAVTPAIERAWAVQRELGERFVQVRWPREDGVEAAMAMAQQLKNPNITRDFQLKIGQFMDVAALKKCQVELPDPVRFAHLAEVAATLRGQVVRDPANRNVIIDFPQCELPTRLMSAMTQVAIGHAMLFRREHVTEDDVKVAYRIGMDSIPLSRLRVVQAVQANGGAAMPAEIVKETGLHHASVDWIADELEWLKVIWKDDIGHWRYTDRFTELWAKARGETGTVVTFPGRSSDAVVSDATRA